MQLKCNLVLKMCRRIRDVDVDQGVLGPGKEALPLVLGRIRKCGTTPQHSAVCGNGAPPFANKADLLSSACVNICEDVEQDLVSQPRFDCPRVHIGGNLPQFRLHECRYLTESLFDELTRAVAVQSRLVDELSARTVLSHAHGALPQIPG